MRKIILFLLVLVTAGMLYAAPTKEKTESLKKETTESVKKETIESLKVGIMPDADSLPFMVARDEGLFEAEGVNVELVVFSNPQERDSAIQSGNVDGSISDLLAAAFFYIGGFDTKITSLTDGRYGIAASPTSDIQDLTGLAGKQIGLSTNTIIQYTVDAQLEKAGVGADNYTPVSVPRMPLRMEMLLAGQIDAASMPEPLLTAVVGQGAILLSTTDTLGIDAGILLFSKKVLDNRLDDVKKFYRAYYKAAQKINENPDAYRAFLVEKASFPEAVRDAYQFVNYRKPILPEEAQIDQAVEWLKAKELISTDVTAEDLVDRRITAEW
ncbi:MAG: ABC transporter substrate-binding protein [Treponema sp.]|jgi:NitT/TauT family transport system substrate-binding protein|nr:ABC transporter substrate-binding protein [Treponema sp.]